ncbi:MAG: hypothetical protein M1823_002641 [Watsoniomyces obsoletus]|nr:MAG: hypothetical protein M1823_002641 [Watsoniomyces obsoletus]
MFNGALFGVRSRERDVAGVTSKPSWLRRQITPIAETLSRRACSHPIHTLVFVALLASTTYINLLDGGVFWNTGDVGGGSSRTDWTTLIQGSKDLCVGEHTGWKWQTEDGGRCMNAEKSQHLALATLVFPDSLSPNAPQTAPIPQSLPVPANTSIQLLPSTSNALSPISQDSTLAVAVPYSDAPHLLSTLQEIPDGLTHSRSSGEEGSELRIPTRPRWVMKAARNGNQIERRSFSQWASNTWTEFLDLLKNAESLDIFIMILGYLSMHLTFVSLFLSMRRLGSNFWLAATVLCSSVFAFFFGLSVTTRMGVPLNVVLLSEGLPFLVVTIGFEKPIILTKAVLSASLDNRPRQASTSTLNGALTPKRDRSPMMIQDAVQAAVREKGYDIVRDYFIEILILVAGASSGVQGGLRQFCFLAAWILFFDCLLLFTFYTAILSVKLEINRIKRHMALRTALEEDGVSGRVAENVAQRNDWPKLSIGRNRDGQPETGRDLGIFRGKLADSSVPKFKLLMVLGFMLINIINLCAIPFRSGNRHALGPTVSGLSSVVASPPMDPFKVAGNGLDSIHASAMEKRIATLVTVLGPIKYTLEDPSMHQGRRSRRRGVDGYYDSSSSSTSDDDDLDQSIESMGGKVVASLLKSLEDPVLSKWIILTLAMSLVLNGYLFNAARSSIKDSHGSDEYESTSSSHLERGVDDDNKSNVGVDANVRMPNDEDGIVMRPKRPSRGEHDGEVPEIKTTPMQTQSTRSTRTPAECEQLVKEKRASELTDAELVPLALRGKIPGHALERSLGDATRAVKIRRAVISRTPETSRHTSLLESSLLPYEHYDYAQVLGACCENVIGYMPIPVGVAGPMIIDGQRYFLPMATTEGVLVASTSRGCKAINAGGGAVTVLTGDGMTRGPCIGFETLERAGAAKIWLDSEAGQRTMKKAFDSTSRFARLQSMKTALAGTLLYIRFKTTTGDAMGMNMISKGVEHALNIMANESGFDDMSIVSVSGNFCTDKKPAAINWIDGRGKSVVAEAIIPASVVESVLKTDVDSLVELNISKNLIGSAMAGSIGGFNAHAGNIVTAMFLATGQDPAQNIESSNCLTTMRKLHGDLQINVSMPSIEVGTVGGGTVLEPQGAALDMLGVRGPHGTKPGDNARQLARIIAAGVLAGELSLCSALAAGHLVKSHMAHNRSTPGTRAGTPVAGMSSMNLLQPGNAGGGGGGGGVGGGGGNSGGSGTATPISFAMTSITEKVRQKGGGGGNS